MTLPDQRRCGHARTLTQRLGSWLAAAGVPRMVAVLPEQQMVRRGGSGTAHDGGEHVLKRLRYKPLQDFELLGVSRDHRLSELVASVLVLRRRCTVFKVRGINSTYSLLPTHAQMWKAEWHPYYTRELIGQRARVLVRDLRL